MKNLNLLFLLTALLFTAVSCDEDDEIIDNPFLPDEIVVNNAGLYPEGIDYSEELDRYIITSLTTGQVGTVDDDGNYEVLINDPEIISAIGVLVDDSRDRILVAISDPGASSQSTMETMGRTAKLGIYDQETGERMQMVDLAALHEGGPAFANDIAIDDDGNAYVTNSFATYIYKVTPEGEASIFYEDADNAIPQGAFGLNGIVFNDDEDYLIVAQSNTKQLFKLTVEDTPVWSEINVDATLPTAPDGLELEDDDQLVVVANEDSQVVLLEGSDDFASATITSTFNTPSGVFPTTAAQRNDEIYVLYAYLGKLFAGDASQATYPIQRVDFE